MKCKITIHVFTLFLLLFHSSFLFAKDKTCVDWPKVMTQSDLDQMPKNPSILIQPFVDFTKQGGDDWLVLGLRDYLSDILRAGKNIRVPPIATETKDFTITGKFQHISGNLRVFVSILNGKNGELLKQLEITFSYPGNRDFFVKLSQAATEIIKIAGAKPDTNAIARIRDATASTRAYEAYSKGRQLLENFQPEKSEAASIWFNEAKKIDYRSPLGYTGMINLYTFLGLYHKQRQEPFALYFQKAEEEISQMKKVGIKIDFNKIESKLINDSTQKITDSCVE